MILEENKKRMLFLLYLTCDYDTKSIFQQDNADDMFNISFHCDTEGMGYGVDRFIFGLKNNDKISYEMIFKKNVVKISKFFEGVLNREYKLSFFNRNNKFNCQLFLSFDDSLEIEKDITLAIYTFTGDILTDDVIEENIISNVSVIKKDIIGNGPGLRRR